MAPGTSTITGKAGTATSTVSVEVVGGTVGRVAIEPGTSTVRGSLGVPGGQRFGLVPPPGVRSRASRERFVARGGRHRGPNLVCGQPKPVKNWARHHDRSFAQSLSTSSK